MRTFVAKDFIQRTLYDGTMMINNNRPPREVLKYLLSRFQWINNAPSYVNIVWDEEYSNYKMRKIKPDLLLEFELAGEDFLKRLYEDNSGGFDFEKEEQERY